MKCLVAIGLLLTATGLQAASCGSVGTPSACTLTVGGNILYTFSGFSLVNSVGSQIYTGSEIGIDVFAAGENSAGVTFSKLIAETGVVFFANAGETKNFLLQYSVDVSAVGPGTAAFAAPSVVSIGQSSAVGNGTSIVQMIVAADSIGVSCLALRNIGGVSDGICSTLPEGAQDALLIGEFFNLFGNTGNTSMNNISNVFNATFTPAQPSGVPEPSTWLMMGMGLALLAGRRRLAC